MIFRNNPYLICFSASLFFFYVIFQMSLFSTISPELMIDFNLDPVKLGNISSLYFYADALFLIPAGLMLDRFSTRKLLLVVMLISCISMLVFGLTKSVFILGLCRAIWGIGNAFAFLGCLRLVSVWFPSSRVALIMGLCVTVGMLGGVIAQFPIAYLLKTINWRYCVILCAMVGAVFLIINFIFTFDNSSLKTNGDQIKKISHDLVTCIKNKQNWLCGIYASCLNLPVTLLSALWANLYLIQVHHITMSEASFVTSMIFFGIILGAPLMGSLSDKLKSRKKPMFFGAIFTLILILAIIAFTKLSAPILIILFLLLGFFSSAQVISYPTVAESNPESVSSTAMSIVAIFINIIGAVSQPLFGLIMRESSLNNLSGVSAASSYGSALWIMPTAFLISAIVAVFIKDTLIKTKV